MITKSAHYRGRGAHLHFPPVGELFVVADDEAAIDTVWSALNGGQPPQALEHKRNQNVIIVAAATFAESAKKEGA